MKIEFRKIPYQESPFSITHKKILFEGSFKRDSSRLVSVNSLLSGQMSLQCDRCGEDFIHKVHEPLVFKVSDGNFSGEDMDIIECENSIIDFDEIALSEIEAIRSDYHYCDTCK